MMYMHLAMTKHASNCIDDVDFIVSILCIDAGAAGCAG